MKIIKWEYSTVESFLSAIQLDAKISAMGLEGWELVSAAKLKKIPLAGVNLIRAQRGYIWQRLIFKRPYKKPKKSLFS